VAEIAQPGLGHWEPAREYTDSAGADFWLALSHWEAGPDEDTKARVKSTYKAVLDAWRRAAAEYELEEA